MALPTIEEAARMCLLDPQQRALLERSITTGQRALYGRSAPYEGVSDEAMFRTGEQAEIDEEQVRANLRRDQEMLNRLSPLSFALTPYEIHKARKIVDELDAKIREGMPSYDQMQVATAENIDLNLRWQETKVPFWCARRTFLRLLDPNNDDPNFVNVERLRPKEAVHVDFRSYYKRWDEIQMAFDEDIEQALEDLDDDRFTRFCQMKAAEVSTTIILRELGFTKLLYEAAMAKLRTIRDQMGTPSSETSNGEGPAAPMAEPESVRMGKSLREAIRQRGIVQAAFARALDLTPALMHAYLSEHTRPPADLWERAHALLGQWDADPHCLDAYLKGPAGRKE